MILSVKAEQPIWPIGSQRLHAGGMEAIRRLIQERADALGKTLKELSLDLDLNETYLQQFVKYGKPKKGLPENVRRPLAKLLNVNEVELGASPEHLRIAEPGGPAETFKIDEIDVQGSAGYGGIEPGGGYLEFNNKDGEEVKRPASTGTFYFPEDYARKVLGLHVGRADILPIKGDSMDDGSKYALVDGDRVIIDLASRDVRQGAIFAVWDGEGVIIKQIEIDRNSSRPKLICTSLNPRYKPFDLYLTENVHVIGRVVAKLARM